MVSYSNIMAKELISEIRKFMFKPYAFIKRFSFTLAQLTRFGIVGILANILNFIVFILCLNFFGIYIKISSIIGYLCGLLVSFHFGRTWILGDRFRYSNQTLFKFLFSYLFGAWLMQELVAHFSNSLGINSYLSWFLSAFPVAISNFLFIKYWVFSKGIKRLRTNGDES